MLDKIKLLLSIVDDTNDDLLNTLIAMCKEEAYIYCNLQEYDKKLDNIVASMVVEKYNRMGSEGAISQSASGISASYDSFYSDKVVRMIKRDTIQRVILHPQPDGQGGSAPIAEFKEIITVAVSIISSVAVSTANGMKEESQISVVSNIKLDEYVNARYEFSGKMYKVMRQVKRGSEYFSILTEMAD